MTTYSDIELDALRELANIGSGNAATSLSALVGQEIDVDVPRALALSLADAVESAGPAEQEVVGVALQISGDMDAIVLLVFPEQDAATLCGLLGVDPNTEVGQSALGEIGNILGSSYVGALASMTGIQLEPHPPQTIVDMLAAIVSTVLAAGAQEDDVALMLDSNLNIAGTACSLAFMLVPSRAGVAEMLVRLGLPG